MLKERFNRQSKHCKPGMNTHLHLKSLSSRFPAPPPPPGSVWQTRPVRGQSLLQGWHCRGNSPKPRCACCWLLVCGDSRMWPPTCGCWPRCRVSVLRAGVICGPGVRPGARVWVSGGYGGSWERYKRTTSGFGNGLSEQRGVWVMDPGKRGLKVCLCRLLSTSTGKCCWPL